MLDREQTRERFLKWVNSRAFNAQCKARFHTRLWPFIAAAISFAATRLLEDSKLFEPLLLASFFLPIWGWNLWNIARKERKAFRKSLDHHEPMLCALVIGNRKLFHTKGARSPALLVGDMGPQPDESAERLLAAAEALAYFYGTDPSATAPELQEVCRMINDDAYRPDRRHKVPEVVPDLRGLWLFDTMLVGDDLPAGSIETR